MYTSLTDVTVLKHATEKIFRAMSQREEIIEHIYDCIHGSESNEMYSVMVELVNRLDDNIDAEERSEDETWFDGLGQSFNTKEDVMRNAAKSRVRKYFSNARESFEKVSSFLLMHDSCLKHLVGLHVPPYNSYPRLELSGRGSPGRFHQSFHYSI